MTEHIGSTQQVKAGPWTVAYFGACSCGHTGPERERISQAAADLSLHFRDVAREAVDGRGTAVDSA